MWTTLYGDTVDRLTVIRGHSTRKVFLPFSWDSTEVTFPKDVEIEGTLQVQGYATFYKPVMFCEAIVGSSGIAGVTLSITGAATIADAKCSTITVSQLILAATVAAPASNATCASKGIVKWDGAFLYISKSTNEWTKVALSTY